MPTNTIRQPPIDPDQIRRLGERTFLESVEHHAVLESTNDRGLALLAAAAVPKGPHLIYAETQSAGRGRGGRQWFSAPGSLTFSLIDTRSASVRRPAALPRLALFAGVAVLQACRPFVAEGTFGLKWPNDVYLGDRKVAGILIEVPQGGTHTVIGIGVNVNNLFEDANPETAARATSLSEVAAGPIDRLELLTAILDRLEVQLGRWASGDSPPPEWDSHCLLQNREVTIRAADRQQSGICRGIDPAGRLLIESGGEQTAWAAGEITAWK
jgi:BirA family biotin operon repressor/biotin-[acetyl-CoA-carboxylase] ligase